MSRKTLVVLAASVLALLLFSGIALAQNVTGNNIQGKPPLFDNFIEKLAANLGMDKTTLQEAIKKTHLQIIDEAVQQGRIPADRAQEMKNRIEQGQFPPMGPRFDGRPPLVNDQRLKALAEAFGMSVDELKTAIEQGKRIPDIAQEKGISLDQLQQKMKELRIQEINQMVQDGKITREQADRMIQRIQNAPQGPHKGFYHKGWQSGPVQQPTQQSE